MKKALFITAIAALTAVSGKAQSLHVCNKNGTTIEIPIKEYNEIRFDAKQKFVKFTDLINDYWYSHYFATAEIDSIVPRKPLTGTPLETDVTPEVTIGSDTPSFDEITETIITDETIDEAGDFIENYTPEKRVTITFSETGVSVTPGIVSGIKFAKKGDTHLTIDATVGKVQYIVKGKCSDGSLKIYSTKKFQMMLGGLDLTNCNGPAINIQTGKTIYFTLGAGTTNSLCDGVEYDEAPTTGGKVEDQKGTLFAEGQIIFNGTGTLNITSLGGHGICSDDYIRIRSGKINILSAVKDGFHTNDIFRVGRTAAQRPEISVSCAGDAIDCGKGNVLIEAGTLTLSSAGEAIKVSNEDSDSTVSASATIRGGLIKIYTSESKSSAIKCEGNYTQSGGVVIAQTEGDGSKIINCDGSMTLSGGHLTGIATGNIHAADTTSAAGVKCAGALTVKGGTMAIKCTGEGAKAINCDSNVTIDGGSITLMAEGENYYDDTDNKKARAITCTDLTVNGGTLIASSDKDIAISADNLTLNGGTVKALSPNNASSLNSDIYINGGWLMLKCFTPDYPDSPAR
ncbi:MAG: carbohydrate-binding domain-containing protein [Bacteroidaceae bacterium]|nr:carbohydrate-binding domain-containing protein [Bacteroidaceae bacterium]